MNITRRGFMKLLGVSAGAAVVGLPIFDDKFELIGEAKHWIEDKGDYLIVRVPNFKTFANELLEKPTLFLMGEKASVSAVTCRGFVNIHGDREFMFKDCFFDSRGMKFANRRKGLVSVEAGDPSIISSVFYIEPGTDACLDFRGCHNASVSDLYVEVSDSHENIRIDTELFKARRKG